jgi:hypothetical protein
MSDYREFPKALLPPVGGDSEQAIANSPGEEAGFLAQGFRLPGNSDPEGFADQIAGAPHQYVPAEYPKFVTPPGKEDPVIVNSRLEETAVLGRVDPQRKRA